MPKPRAHKDSVLPLRRGLCRFGWLLWLSLGCGPQAATSTQRGDPSSAWQGVEPSGDSTARTQANPSLAAQATHQPASTTEAHERSTAAGNAGHAAMSGGDAVAHPSAGGVAGEDASTAGEARTSTVSAAGSSGSEASPSAGMSGMFGSAANDAAMPDEPDASSPSGGPDAAGSVATDDSPLTVFIASDSTASNYKDTPSDSDQAGWGQMLPEYLDPRATVDNRAIGGRTARRFIDEGHLDEIWRAVEPGDYLLVQFGTNDGNRSATYTLNGQQIPYYLDPATDFKAYVQQYIEGARSRDVTVVLVTPPPRNSAYCTGGNGTGAHAQALRELGESEDVSVVDLNQMTVQYLTAICPEPTPPDFFLQRADGSVDGTHFQERGARKLASFVASGLTALGVTWATTK